jgi:glycosyltransferase involved in cell wall biosynthesis
MYAVVMAAGPSNPFILEALGSIYSQTLAPAEVYVVVNGGGEKEPGALRGVREEYPQVVVLESVDPGMWHALNKGLAASTAPYVAFLDTDDIWCRDKQQRQIEALDSAAGVDAVYGLVTNFRIDASGERISLLTAPAMTFTNTTFRYETFLKFGVLDGEATHFSWLYRWWSKAQLLGIKTLQLDHVSLLRRIHKDNSWIHDHEEAKSAVLAEVRRHLRSREPSP